MRKLLFTLALAGGLALCPAQTATTEVDDFDQLEPEYVNDINGEDADIDTIDEATRAATIEAARTITAEELKSPMMSINLQKTTNGNNSRSLFDWCLDHLFLSSILALVLTYGGTWLIYRICSYLFITRKKS